MSDDVHMTHHDVDGGLNDLSHQVIGAAIDVHRELGPGLLERTYRLCLAHELRARGLRVGEEIGLPVIFRGIRIEQALRIDLLVEEVIVVELKAVTGFHRSHEAQMWTYLRMSGCPLGLLLNFHTFPLAIRRYVGTL